VNTTEEEKKVPISGTRKGLVTHRTYQGTISLGPQQVDLIE
jgi:hypothetical protein